MYRAAVFGAALLWLVPIMSAQTIRQPEPIRPIADAGDFLGDQSCQACHRDKFASHQRTAHRLTSQLASADAIKGSFTGVDATMATRNPVVSYRLEARADGFYQSAIWRDAPEKTHTERFDIVTGSGRKGQSYLYWKGDGLFQLPLSYFTETRRWINSPGFGDGVVNFDRAITPRCLECHATLFQQTAAPNHYKKTELQLGVGCEKCHGPGRAHVEQQRANPGARPQGIVNTARLSRDRQVELCESCHARLQPITASFSYRPGQPLADHFRLDTSQDTTPLAGDVHGNQVGMLRLSRCFQSSAMTCSTCHDVHREQRDVASFAQKCTGCHRMQQCKRFKQDGRKIAGKCVDCHMPVEISNAIVIATAASGPLQPMGRTHKIGIYRN